MSDPLYITVTAPPGVRTPIHPSDGVEPGGGTLYVEIGTVCRVRYSQTIRRSIGRSDLIPCDMNGAAVSVALASAPHALAGGKVLLTTMDSGGGKGIK